MNFLIRLLLVPLAGMFILFARRAEESYQQHTAQVRLAPASQPCTAPVTRPAVIPAFVTASFMRFPPPAIGAALSNQRALPVSR
jgi:hypothetical protein